MKKIKMVWRRWDLNAYAARFTLILASIHVVVMLVRDFQDKDTHAEPLWILGLTACSLGFRALSRLDRLAEELRTRARAVEGTTAAAHMRLNEMDGRLSTVVVRVRREIP